MEIAIDIDEVLASCIDAYIKFSNERFNTTLSFKDFSHWNWAECTALPQDVMAERIIEFVESSFYDEMEPIPGSHEAIRELATWHSLHAVTSRWGKQVPKTEPWLNHHFPNTFKGLHFSHNPIAGVTSHGKKSKSQICFDLKASVIIDDSLSFANECAGQNLSVILLDYPWNRENVAEGVIRASSWDNIPAIIKRLET